MSGNLPYTVVTHITAFQCQYLKMEIRVKFELLIAQSHSEKVQVVVDHGRPWPTKTWVGIRKCRTVVADKKYAIYHLFRSVLYASPIFFAGLIERLRERKREFLSVHQKLCVKRCKLWNRGGIATAETATLSSATAR